MGLHWFSCICFVVVVFYCCCFRSFRWSVVKHYNFMNLCGLGYPDFMLLFYIHTSCGVKIKFQILKFPAVILIWATESNFLSLIGLEGFQYFHSLAYFSIYFSLLNSKEADLSWIQGRAGHWIIISVQWPTLMTWWRWILHAVSNYRLQVCLSQTYFRQLRWREVLGLLSLWKIAIQGHPLVNFRMKY